MFWSKVDPDGGKVESVAKFIKPIGNRDSMAIESEDWVDEFARKR